MPGLAKAVERLVASATGGGKDAALRAAVEEVLESFDAADTKEAKTALGILESGIAKAEGRAAQVLNLALGALVEGGAPPELAWPAASRGLVQALDVATTFARACVEKSGEAVVNDAIAAAGAAVAKKHPQAAAAWVSLASRCLAAVACLTRSKKLRDDEHASGALAEAVYSLEEAVEEVSFLSQALRILDGTIIVVHPESKRAFRLAVSDLCSNVELYVLATETLVEGGKIEGTRPDGRAVAVLRDPENLPKKPPTVVTAFRLSPWPGVEELWLEGSPYDLPSASGERIVVIEDSEHPHVVTVEPSFPALRPSVTFESELAKSAVTKLLSVMEAAAAQAKKAKAKKPTKTKAPKTKTKTKTKKAKTPAKKPSKR